jgi:hypothetical protein
MRYIVVNVYMYAGKNSAYLLVYRARFLTTHAITTTTASSANGTAANNNSSADTAIVVTDSTDTPSTAVSKKSSKKKGDKSSKQQQQTASPVISTDQKGLATTDTTAATTDAEELTPRQMFNQLQLALYPPEYWVEQAEKENDILLNRSSSRNSAGVLQLSNKTMLNAVLPVTVRFPAHFKYKYPHIVPLKAHEMTSSNIPALAQTPLVLTVDGRSTMKTLLETIIKRVSTRM